MEGLDKATWLDVADVHDQFPTFSLEDKAAPAGEAIEVDRVEDF